MSDYEYWHPHERSHTMTTDADIIIALARKLEAKNLSTLEAENAQLRRERDQLKADAMSDLIKRHWLENQVRNREAERDFLRAENAALRAGQGAWTDDDHHSGDQVPRVITTEELRVGQLICIHRGHGWGVRAIGEFRELFGNKITLKAGGSGTFSESIKFHTIVLLEDAPEPFVMADWERELLQEKADKDPAPRLTVHALNTAPVGSRVYQGEELCFIKENDGEWSAGFDLTRPSEWILRSIPNAILTHPEGGDDE